MAQVTTMVDKVLKCFRLGIKIIYELKYKYLYTELHTIKATSKNNATMRVN